MKFGKYLKDIGKEAGRQHKQGNHLHYIGTPAADLSVKAAKLMTRKTDPGIANLWTGRRESGLGVTAAFGAAAVYGGVSYQQKTTFVDKSGEVSYQGTAPIMDADGVGSKAQAPTLGANGNMVFGLHNARKG